MPVPPAPTLPELQLRAGAVMTKRAGRELPAHYGSSASELAVCIAGVGLADRSDLSIFSVSATKRSLDRLVIPTLRRPVAANDASLEHGVWWARDAGGTELLAICSSEQRPKLEETLARTLTRVSNGLLVDLTDAYFVANILGPRTPEMLDVFGVAATPRRLTRSDVAGHAVTWLAEGPTGAVLIADRDAAGAVWYAMELAGRRFGLVCVGLESVSRYRVAERARTSASALL